MEKNEVLGILKTFENLKPDVEESKLDLVADLVSNHTQTIDF